MSKSFTGAVRTMVMLLLIVATVTLTGCFCCDYEGYDHDCGGAYHHGGRGYRHGSDDCD